MCLDPARALRSCCLEFYRKQFECRSVLSRLFLFIVQTALVASRQQQQKIHAQNSLYVEKSLFASQAMDPD